MPGGLTGRGYGLRRWLALGRDTNPRSAVRADAPLASQERLDVQLLVTILTAKLDSHDVFRPRQRMRTTAWRIRSQPNPTRFSPRNIHGPHRKIRCAAQRRLASSFTCAAAPVNLIILLCRCVGRISDRLRHPAAKPGMHNLRGRCLWQIPPNRHLWENRVNRKMRCGMRRQQVDAPNQLAG